MKKYLIACWFTKEDPDFGTAIYGKKWSKDGDSFQATIEDEKNHSYLTKLLSLMKIIRNREVQTSDIWIYRTTEKK